MDEERREIDVIREAVIRIDARTERIEAHQESTIEVLHALAENQKLSAKELPILNTQFVKLNETLDKLGDRVWDALRGRGVVGFWTHVGSMGTFMLLAIIFALYMTRQEFSGKGHGVELNVGRGTSVIIPAPVPQPTPER